MAGPPLQDPSTPAAVKSTGNPVTTAAFNPPANSVIFAICLADELNTFVITDNLAVHLTWASIGVSVNQSASGSIMVFRAVCAAGATGMTITSTRTGSFTAHGLIPVVFTKAEMGAFSGAKAAAITAAVNITTTGPDSQVYAGHVEESGTADTAATGCTFFNASTNFGGINGGGLQRTASVGVAGTTVSIGVAAGSGPSIVAFEVKAAPDSAPGFTPIGPGLAPFARETPWLGTENVAAAANVVSATAALTAVSSVSDTALVGMAASAALTATSGLSSTAGLTEQAAATLTAVSGVSANGVDTGFVSATLTATSSLSASAQLTEQAAATLGATSSVGANAALQFASATLTAVSSLAAAATEIELAGATLTATSSVVADGTRIGFGTATLTGISSVLATGKLGELGTATLAATSSVSADGRTTDFVAATLGATSSLMAVSGAVPGIATLSAVSSVSAAGVRVTGVQATIDATSSLAAGALHQAVATAVLAAVSNLLADGRAIGQSAALLQATSALLASGTVIGSRTDWERGEPVVVRAFVIGSPGQPVVFVVGAAKRTAAFVVGAPIVVR